MTLTTSEWSLFLFPSEEVDSSLISFPNNVLLSRERTTLLPTTSSSETGFQTFEEFPMLFRSFLTHSIFPYCTIDYPGVYSLLKRDSGPIKTFPSDI